ncbi:MAG TPA: YqcI/YcgG family protein [Solirubrobacteraceae bacterium]|nr:YqcI/YcgG family protein [Solirubrobacteraceae bacterium]
MSPATRQTPSTIIGPQPAWGANVLERFTGDLAAGETPFPCTFATAALRQRHLQFAFIDDAADERAWAPLPRVLERYVTTSQEIAQITSLVVFFRDEYGPRWLDWYEERFWAILQYLHAHDPVPWPADLPRDPEDPSWEFAFAGEPVFVVCNTPAHEHRRSRCSPELTITFQPRSVFDGLEADMPRGQAARRTIRQRLSRYDAPLEPSPELGSYGHAGNREWRQYFLRDSNRAAAGRGCPLRTQRSPTPLPR